MANTIGYTGVNFNNLRKALYLLFFGAGAKKDNKGNLIGYESDDFSSAKYKYIIPMQGNFENPLQEQILNKNTFMMYWIEKDESLTQDDYTFTDEGEAVNRQKCVASVLLRFVGKDAETLAKVFRHLCKRKDVTKIWYGVCNAEKLVYTMPIVPRKINYTGENSQVVFDVRFKLYYDECIATSWKPLEGVNFNISGNIKLK
ncbi:MAG: hypothetical protein J5978_09600 [Spirochaetaceae bacterium]|nr:hypothetical protein [Spirochaetaceae bacterium]MBO5483565.1 hypothetical protein [Spirochaetaceae bacterium]